MKISAIVGLVLVILVVVAAVGCSEVLRSDSANALRQSSQANKEALRALHAATSQAEAAQPVSGPALVQMLSGQTHVSEFRKQTGDAKPYFTSYKYFGPDGVYIVRDTYARSTIPYQAVGQWRVTDAVLCLRDSMDYPDENCFTLKVTPAGKIQFWIHKPGDPFHGLLTSSVDIVHPGLQTLEYTTSPSNYR